MASDHAGPPIYLSAHLDDADLAAYARDVAALLEGCPRLARAVARPDKIDAIAACLRHLLLDMTGVHTAQSP